MQGLNLPTIFVFEHVLNNLRHKMEFGDGAGWLRQLNMVHRHELAHYSLIKEHLAVLILSVWHTFLQAVSGKLAYI